MILGSVERFARQNSSPLFSVESELRHAQLNVHEIEHGDEMRGGTADARLAFGCAKHAIY